MKTKNNIFKLSLFAGGFLYLLFVLSIFFIPKINSNKNILYVEDGAITITKDMVTNKSYSLLGEWEYYKDRTIKYYDDFKFVNSTPYEFKEINNFFTGKSATFKIKINNESSEPIGVRFFTFYNPHNIYVNGKSIFGDEDFYTGTKNPIVQIPKERISDLVITLDRNNFFILGFPNAPTIGNYISQYQQWIFKEKMLDGAAVIAIALLTTIISLFILKSRKIKDYAHLFLMFITILFISKYVVHKYFYVNSLHTISYFLNFKIYLITGTLILLSLASYIYVVVIEFKKSKYVYYTTALLELAFVIFAIFCPVELSQQLYNFAIIMHLFIIATTFSYMMYYPQHANMRRGVFSSVLVYISLLGFTLDLFTLHLGKTSTFILVQNLAFIILILGEDYSYFTTSALRYAKLREKINYRIYKDSQKMRIKNALIKEEIQKGKIAENNLIELTIKDHLTGVYNRFYANKTFKDLIKKYSLYGHNFSVIILDIDNFKYINDTFGHDVGDDTLRTVAHTLIDNTRFSDTLVRWGGEEFIVILNYTNLDNAIYVAEKLRKIIADKQINVVGKITISLGVAETKSETSLEELVSRADEYLLKAKRSGKNCTYPKSIY
ncbi:MAG: GGDEF domain-containing protein [Lachnospirales bacterium]